MAIKACNEELKSKLVHGWDNTSIRMIKFYGKSIALPLRSIF